MICRSSERRSSKTRQFESFKAGVGIDLAESSGASFRAYAQSFALRARPCKIRIVMELPHSVTTELLENTLTNAASPCTTRFLHDPYTLYTIKYPPGGTPNQWPSLRFQAISGRLWTRWDTI